VHESSTELIALKEAQDQQAGFQQSLPVFLSDLDEISQRQQQEDSLLDFSFDRHQVEGSYLFYQERIQLIEAKNTDLEKRLLSLNSHLQTLTLQIQSEVNNKLYLQEECERLRREITHYKKQTDLAEMQCNSLAGEKEQIKQLFRTAVDENKKLRTALKIMHDQVASLSLSLDKLSY
jgi:chromosome segregation ATPase